MIILLTILLLTAICSQAVASSPDESLIKDIISKYYDTRYQALSVLEEKDISSFWKTENNPEYDLEVNALSTDINHRKMQLIDLRFEKYNLKMDFKSIDVLNNKANVKVAEYSGIYQNASPDVCSELWSEHTIKMEKINGKWLMVSDNSPDLTKRALLLIIEKGGNASEAKAEIIESSKQEVIIKKEEALRQKNNIQKEPAIQPLSLQSYNVTNAVQYAMTWALSRNPAWGNYTGQGGDCTNFISQCLYAGGIPFDTVGNPNYNQRWFWYSYSNRTPTWTGVNQFWDYALNDIGYGLYTSQVSRSGVYKGDIIQLVSGSSGYHSLFVNNAYTYNGYRFIFICCHDTDRKDYNLDNFGSVTKRYLHINGWYN